MKQFRSLQLESENWVLRYYDEDEELIIEQFTTLDNAKAHIEETFNFHLNFEPPLN